MQRGAPLPHPIRLLGVDFGSQVVKVCVRCCERTQMIADVLKQNRNNFVAFKSGFQFGDIDIVVASSP